MADKIKLTCAYEHCDNVLVDGDGPICLKCEKDEERGREMLVEMDREPEGSKSWSDGDRD